MSERRRRFHPLLFGAIAGLALGNLLLGLNPHLLTPPSVARLLSGGAALGALLFVPLSLRAPRGTRPRGRPLLFAGTALALLAVAVEGERRIHYVFLINGSRRVLVATSLALAVASLSLLACAARPPRAAGLTRVLAGSLALLLLPPFVGRRAPERTPLASPTPMAERRNRSLLLVGLEGVSWELLSGWASDGSLPVFARLLKEGAAGPLVAAGPYVRSAVWTTAATGKYPAKHGVVADVGFTTPLGELHLLPCVSGTREPRRLLLSRPLPLGGRLRRSLAFWEILSARGHGVAVLGWPASYPARPGPLLWATEELFAGDRSPEAGSPPEAAEAARLLAAEGAPIDRFLARTLVPQGLSPADAARGEALAGARHDLAVVGAALAALPHGPASVSAFVLDGLAREARFFTPAATPERFWGLAPRDAEPRTRALRAYYRFLDETLGDLLEREGGDRLLCVFAPAGWGHRATLAAVRDVVLGREPEAGPENDPQGFVLLRGEGIRSGVRLTAASVADLAPTLLVLSGEPIARDMDGRVLAEAFDERFARESSVPIVTTFEPEGPQ